MRILFPDIGLMFRASLQVVVESQTSQFVAQRSFPANGRGIVLAIPWRLLLVGLMYGHIQCLHQNGLGRDLIDLRCCEGNGTEAVGNDRTSMVSATVSARKIGMELCLTCP
jgi:hypothetical protein